jgi:hypothetical protein
MTAATSATLAGQVTDESGLGNFVLANGSTRTAGAMLVGDGSNWVSSTISGDGTMGAGGVLAVTDDSHNHVTTNIDAATSATWLAQVTDELPGTYFVASMGNTMTAGSVLVSDGSRFTTQVMSGDATINNAGAVAVADDSHNHVWSNIDSATSATVAGQISDESGAEGKFIVANGSSLTSGNILVADGSNWNSSTMSGSCTMAAGGVITCSGSGDVTSVGDCTTGSCLDGTTSGGNFLKVSGRGGLFNSNTGILALGSSKAGANAESITLDFETTANQVAIGSTSGVTTISLGSLNLTSTGVIDKYTRAFNPYEAKLNSPAAAIDAANNQWRGLFDQTLEECMTFEDELYPYSSSTLKAEILYSVVTKPTAGTNANINFFFKVGCTTPGDAEDVDAITYGSSAVVLNTVPTAAAGYLAIGGTATAINDSCAQGDFLTLQFCRNAPNTLDTVASDLELRKVLLYE